MNHSAAGGDDFCSDCKWRRADEAEPDSFGEDQQPEHLQEFSPEAAYVHLAALKLPTRWQWMVNAVDNGIARNAGVSGVKVAGKTGTAETTAGLNNSWFYRFRAG